MAQPVTDAEPEEKEHEAKPPTRLILVRHGRVVAQGPGPPRPAARGAGDRVRHHHRARTDRRRGTAGLARHHRRRFVTQGYLTALARCLQPGAEFRVATDIPDYVRQTLEEVPPAGFQLISQTGQGEAWDDWLSTRYEQKALREGHVRAVVATDALELGINVYNLFNKFDLRGNGGIANSGVNPVVIGGAPVLGRTVTASVRYNF